MRPAIWCYMQKLFQYYDNFDQSNSKLAHKNKLRCSTSQNWQRKGRRANIITAHVPQKPTQTQVLPCLVLPIKSTTGELPIHDGAPVLVAIK
jgi:hypothetical protein